jgi:heterodisulfide reductase subunit C
VVQPPKIKMIPAGNQEFSRYVRGKVKNLGRCYQCLACSHGCQVAYAMDYHPAQIVHMVRLGLKEKVLQCSAIWMCLSCEMCVTRCPNGVDFVGLMDVLRGEALRQRFNVSANKIPEFHKTFIQGIRKGAGLTKPVSYLTTS